MNYYIVEDGGKIVPIDPNLSMIEQMEQLAVWQYKEVRGELPFVKGGQRVAKDLISNGQGEPITVSTVFLWLDHGWGGGPPILFETMIFGGEHDGYQDRYCTHEEVLEGHAKAVKLVESGVTESDKPIVVKGD